MSFEFKKTEIENLIIISSHTFEDNRGLYNKTFEKKEYKANGIDEDFNECSTLYSAKGALRGLHYQTKDSQAKLLHCVRGKLFDVAVDLRKGSKTFGKYHCELLEGDDDIVIYIPKGFAHGFIALEDNTIFSYQCSGTYLPEYCGGIRWNDSDLNIPWPLDEYGIEKIIATDKDLNWPTLKEYMEKIKCEKQ